MISLKKKILVVVFCSCFSCFGKQHIITLGNEEEALLSIDLLGGAFIDFRLNESSLNPFSWAIPANDMPANNKNGAPFQGHFLCLGRWGAPTDGEIKAGVPHNGQPGNQLWNIVEQSADSFLRIRSESPLDGIVAERKIYFDKLNTVFKVTDYVQSTISVGRLFNIVQHATIGAPFLSSSTIIDCNAVAGFMQHLSYPDSHAYEYVWPNAVIDTLKNSIDLTRSNAQDGYVSTHIFNDSIGWVTASSPDSELLLGYIWKTKEYPWINIWHDVKNGKPHAKGLEFGTTGIGRSYQDLLATDTRFHGKNSFFFLDALESFEKSFICFQVEIPKDYKGVEKVEMKNGQIILTEKSKPDSRITNIDTLYTIE